VQRGPLTPVLLYHSVADGEGDRWTVEPARFADHARALAGAGVVGLTFGDYAARLARAEPLPARTVVVTFDDGYADNRAAIEVLRGHGLPATLFVTTGWIGRPPMLSRAGVADLAAGVGGVEIGAHGVTHQRLDELADTTVREELTASRTCLEDLTGRPVPSFAYPHGAHAARTKRLVAEAGYSAAAAVRNALSHPGDDRLGIARWTVTRSTSAGDLLDLVEGRAGRPAPAHELLRTRVSRVARRGRRALGVPLRR
jgi:peptidoglycan/xylan/chitin deacetylase (PgdA/CDA1 family)